MNPRGSYINSPVSDFDDIPRTFLDTRFNRSSSPSSQSLFNNTVVNNDDDVFAGFERGETDPNTLTYESFNP